MINIVVRSALARSAQTCHTSSYEIAGVLGQVLGNDGMNNRKESARAAQQVYA